MLQSVAFFQILHKIIACWDFTTIMLGKKAIFVETS